jgi:hypothetical protein
MVYVSKKNPTFASTNGASHNQPRETMTIENMTKVSENLASLNLTDMETLFMFSLICVHTIPSDPNWYGHDIRDYCKNLGIDVKVLRGVVGSLAKKGLVDPDFFGDDTPDGNVIGLRREYFWLHPEIDLSCEY